MCVREAWSEKPTSTTWQQMLTWLHQHTLVTATARQRSKAWRNLHWGGFAYKIQMTNAPASVLLQCALKTFLLLSPHTSSFPGCIQLDSHLLCMASMPLLWEERLIFLFFSSWMFFSFAKTTDNCLTFPLITADWLSQINEQSNPSFLLQKQTLYYFSNQSTLHYFSH